jgi:hypothetical protein
VLIKFREGSLNESIKEFKKHSKFTCNFIKAMFPIMLFHYINETIEGIFFALNNLKQHWEYHTLSLAVVNNCIIVTVCIK